MFDSCLISVCCSCWQTWSCACFISRASPWSYGKVLLGFHFSSSVLGCSWWGKQSKIRAPWI